MIKKFLFFLVLFFSFLNAATIQNQNSDNNPSFSNFKPQVYGKCGITANNINKVTNDFFPVINTPFDIKYIDYVFKCPPLSKIIKNTKYASVVSPLFEAYPKKKLLDGNISYSVVLKNVDLTSGDYVCEYDFSNGYNFTINLNNKSCPDFYTTFNKKYPYSLIHSMKKLKFPYIYFNDRFGFLDIYNADNLNPRILYNKFYSDAKMYIEKIYRKMATENYAFSTIDLHSLDSHTNYYKTFPALFVDLLTLNTDLIKSSTIIDKFGRININFPFINNSKNILNLEKVQSIYNGYLSVFNKKMFTGYNELLKKVENKNKYISQSFWGFYFYFFKNIENGFRYIIAIFTFFGATMIFGFATFNKKFNLISTEIQQKFQFDFSKKFLGIAIPFLLFTTPVFNFSTHNSSFDKDFLYNADKVGNDTSNSFTPIQGVMRYSLYMGNWFGNYLNDYAMFAYLKYLTSSIGYNTKYDDVIVNINQKLTDYYLQLLNLKRDYDFVTTLCVLSYPKTFQKYNSFPSNVNPANFDNFNIKNKNSSQYWLNKKYGFSRVDYNLCTYMYNKTLNDSIMLVKYYSIIKNNLKTELQNYNNTNSNFNNNKAVTDFIKNIIKVNNNFGWISSIIVPLIDPILKSAGIMESFDFKSLKNKVETETIKYYNFHYDYQFKPNASKNNNNNTNSSIAEFFKKVLSGASHILPSFIDNSIKTAVSQISSFSVYAVIPGFTTVTEYIYKFYYTVFKVLKNNSFFKIIKGASIFKLVLVFVSIMTAIVLFKFMIIVISMILVTFFALLKIVFYFLEIFMTFLISYAMVLWSLVINPQKAWDAWTSFIFHVAKLTIMPVLIVLMMYSIILANKIFIFAASLIFGIVDFIGSAATKFGSNFHITTENSLNESFDNLLTWFKSKTDYFAIVSFTSSADLIIILITLVMDLIILYKFVDWAFEIFGRPNATGSMGTEMRSIGESMKQKYGGGMI